MPSKPNYRGTGGGGFRSGGYGGGRGFGGGGMSLSFPPFTPMVKKLLIINVAVFFLKLVGGIFVQGLPGWINDYLGFTPALAVGQFPPYLYQFVSYAFVHMGIMHILGNMLMLWMFGSQIEQDFGSRKFLEFYIFCMVGAALTTLAVGGIGYFAFAHSSNAFLHDLGLLWVKGTVGASGAVYGILIAFGILHAEQEIMMFPIPIQMKAKYFVIVTILVTFAFSLGPQGPIAEFAHLGGLLFGFVYLRLLPRQGLGFATSEGLYGIRNRYYKWKRKQAAKKFEVYMKKVDRSQYFDEYGNYRDPNQQKDKSNGEGKGGWVN
jgi:membrane associated rhomboid family serine protease